MKSVLEVRPDGLIYLIKDCPEEPKYTDFVQHIKYYWQVNKFERAKRDYQKALTSCERILCADQEQAKRLIKDELEKKEFARCHTNRGSKDHPIYAVPRKEYTEVKPGIYQVDCEWEEADRFEQNHDYLTPENQNRDNPILGYRKKVAILK